MQCQSVAVECCINKCLRRVVYYASTDPRCALEPGAPISEVPRRLAALIRGGMDSVKLVLAEGARAQISTAAVCASTLRNVFFECFTTFAMAMDKVQATSCALLQAVLPGFGLQE